MWRDEAWDMVGLAGRALIRGGHIGCSGADPTSSNGSRIASH